MHGMSVGILRRQLPVAMFAHARYLLAPTDARQTSAAPTALKALAPPRTSARRACPDSTAPTARAHVCHFCAPRSKQTLHHHHHHTISIKQLAFDLNSHSSQSRAERTALSARAPAPTRAAPASLDSWARTARQPVCTVQLILRMHVITAVSHGITEVCGAHCDQGTCVGSDSCTQCLPGYFGANCESAHTCSAQCADQSFCVADGQCTRCNTHYHGPTCKRKSETHGSMPPTTVAAVNPCLHNNGGCGHWATCAHTGAGKRTCTCLQHFRSPTNNGLNCFGVQFFVRAPTLAHSSA